MTMFVRNETLFKSLRLHESIDFHASIRINRIAIIDARFD